MFVHVLTVSTQEPTKGNFVVEEDSKGEEIDVSIQEPIATSSEVSTKEPTLEDLLLLHNNLK